MKQAHGGRNGHWGYRETMKRLDEQFPGHKIPMRAVRDYVMECAICQKDRLGMINSVQGIVKHLKPLHQRSLIGVDSVKVVLDDFGNEYIINIVVLHTKLSWGYPTPTHDAVSMATAIFVFFSLYGLFDSIISDPGSDLMSDTVNHLNRYLGQNHIVSLVDRHQSCGVEKTNHETLRHLKALAMDERINKKWSSPTVFPLIYILLNNHASTENGNIRPYHAHFGSAVETYFKMPEHIASDAVVPVFVRLLDDNLRILDEASISFQKSLISKRTALNSDSDTRNIFQSGDMILYDISKRPFLPTKLTPKLKGPYKVIQHIENDIECRHMCVGNIEKFHVDEVTRFFGTEADAIAVAQVDYDQYEIDYIITYRGEPTTRTTMEFEILFKDGTLKWLTWTQDLFKSIAYEEFCRKHNELHCLVYTEKESKLFCANLKKLVITLVKPGDKVYVDIRCYGATWYSTLALPNLFHTKYVVEYEYRAYKSNKKQISAYCPVFKETWTVDNYFIYSYGSTKIFDKSSMTLINTEFARNYPQVMPTKVK